MQYVGSIELNRPPYVVVVKFAAPNNKTARLKFDKYCDQIGGCASRLCRFPQGTMFSEFLRKFGDHYKYAITI